MTPASITCLPEKAHHCQKNLQFVLSNTRDRPLRAFTKKDWQWWILSFPFEMYISLLQLKCLIGPENNFFEIESSGIIGPLSPSLSQSILPVWEDRTLTSIIATSRHSWSNGLSTNQRFVIFHFSDSACLLSLPSFLSAFKMSNYLYTNRNGTQFFPLLSVGNE